jgi:phospholipase/lecithinase/hemolysin
MAQYKSLVEEIYADGGRRFLFVNVPPASRSPYILDQGESVSEKHAAWTTAYNDGLASMRAELEDAHDDVSIP